MDRELRKKLSLLLCLMLLFAVVMPQAALAASDSQADKNGSSGIADERIRGCELKVCGRAEVAAEDSIRVYWADCYRPTQLYRIFWKRADKKQWNTADIKAEEGEAGRRSYLLTGLSKNQEYDIRVTGIYLNEKGRIASNDYLSIKGRTYVTPPEYEAFSCISDGSYVLSAWKVHEKNAVLKVYRASSRNGKYTLVGETDGRSDLAHGNYKDVEGKVIFRDEKVKPGKTYYYKAVSEVKLADGSVMTAKSPRVYQLSSKLKPFGSYTAKLLNKENSYTKSLTYKITSSEANYNTKILRKKISLSIKDKVGTEDISSVQYSYNGKKYHTLKSALTVKPGKAVYLRINTKDKIRINKDDRGAVTLGLRYRYNNGRAMHWNTAVFNPVDRKEQVINVDMEDEDGDGPDDGFEVSPDLRHLIEEHIELDYAASYGLEHGGHNGYLEATITKEHTAVLSWLMCPLADSYALRYGTTEEAAKAAKPVVLPKDQFSYEVKDLEPGQRYYFLLSERYMDEQGQMAEELLKCGSVMIDADGWEKPGAMYHAHYVDSASGHLQDGGYVILSWDYCSYGAQSYNVYYGTSEAEALTSTPLVEEQDGFHTNYCRIDNVKKGETYYFILKEVLKDADGTLREVYRSTITVAIPA